MTGVPISRVLSRRKLLGPFFAGDSWDRWRAVLKAAFAESLSSHELQLFQAVSGGRAPPTRRVRELICAVGRGGGKDSAATAIATHLATTSPFTMLRPGERAYVLLIACGRDQARIAFGYLRGYFEQAPTLAVLVERITDNTIDLMTGATIMVGTNSMRAPRGKTVCCALYDECCFWFGEEYSVPDVEVDAAVTPGLMRFPGSMKILISSVYVREGLLYDKYARYFGKDDNDHLAVLGTSLQFNPTLDAAEIDRQIALDPDKMRAEYLSEWRTDISSFLDRGLVEAATDQGIAVRPYDRTHRYTATADPSGGAQDSFVVAISHRDSVSNSVLTDAVLEHRPPFNAAHVIAEDAALCREYRCPVIYGDRYGAELIVQAFAREGIRYEHPRLEEDGPKLNRSAIYLNALPLFTSGRVRLIENQRLTHQLINLRRRLGRGNAKDTVDHSPGSHDDVANAACLGLVLASGATGWDWSRPPSPEALALIGRGNTNGMPTSAVLYAQQVAGRRHALRYGK